MIAAAPVARQARPRSAAAPAGGKLRLLVAAAALLAVSAPAVPACNPPGSQTQQPAANAGKTGASGSPEAEKYALLVEQTDISRCRRLISPGQRAKLPAGAYLAVRLEVTADGTVASAKIAAGSFAHKRFESCLLSLLKKLRLPKPTKALAVQAGFVP